MNKLLTVALLLFVGLCLSSCDKDKKGNPLIVGKWMAINMVGTTNGKVDFSIDYPENCGGLEFTHDGIFGDYGYGQPCALFPVNSGTGSYTTNGLFLTISVGSGKHVEFSYSVSSDILKLTFTEVGEDGTEEDVPTMIFTYRRK